MQPQQQQVGLVVIPVCVCVLVLLCLSGCAGKVQYHGVTRQKWTARFEVHIADGASDIYLGGFDSMEKAAKVHDLAAIFLESRQQLSKACSITLNFAEDRDKMLRDCSTLDKMDVEHFLRWERVSTGGVSAQAAVLTIYLCILLISI